MIICWVLQRLQPCFLSKQYFVLGFSVTATVLWVRAACAVGCSGAASVQGAKDQLWLVGHTMLWQHSSMEDNVIAHCAQFCMWVMSDICCSCILYPIYLRFFPAPSHWVNSSFLARGLKGWKALQTACKVHIQAVYLIFWHILLSLLQNSAQLQKCMSVFFHRLFAFCLYPSYTRWYEGVLWKCVSTEK